MKHRKRGRKLGRTSSHRKALLRNLATALFEHEQIQSTLPKCKELRSFAEKLITLAKRGDLNSRRQAAKVIFGSNLHTRMKGKHDVLRKLFNEIGPRYADRNGGYTRVVRSDIRKGDGAQMAYIQLV
ncbi:50S ribosomal protein L17 [Candidatus Poribacteria bacterium]|jgi:large subunit ribosomal protein L17|nr:50S ribosomal protein L17 [Candidatus Poribacteria bacterium]MEE2912042.1 50S ribosomal protein L17 [Candidatus Poribacteria bacterium]|tara:strand:+ start:99 stop:479 length:381 start_codon:yes stop_codon:yes gene_type:complete